MKLAIVTILSLTGALGIGLCPPAELGRAAAASMGAVGGEKDIIDTAIDAGQFGTLAKALEAAGLIDALRGDGPFTVFAPTDQAFAALGDRGASLLLPENKGRLGDILKFHVVPGRVSAAQFAAASQAITLDGQRIVPSIEEGTLRVNQSRIITADIPCRNGVIHVIDKVLVPAKPDIVQTAREAGHFKTLLAAAKAARLVDTLTGPGPFTVLAPSDDAFKKLPAGTVEMLLKTENLDQLRAVLTYHVIPARAYARDVIGGASVASVQGEQVVFALRDGQLMANDAKVVRTDIDAANGVVHVIDSVLMPRSAPQTPRPALGAADRIIRLAIERGVPLFNAGKPDACEAVYEVAATSLLALPTDQLNDGARKALAAALKDRDGQDDAKERAWTLRRGLDTAFEMNSAGR